METKDIVIIALSTAGFCFSIASFAITFTQKSRESKYGIRNALTDVIAKLTDVDMAHSKLVLEFGSSADDKIVTIKRNYNAQRRYLAEHGEFLYNQISHLVSDIDCSALARAFDAVGDSSRGEKYWKSAVEKSPSNVLLATNLRGMARFYFGQGNASLGRDTFRSALTLRMADTDSIRRYTADTYLLWARAEKDFGFVKEAQEVRGHAISAANRIGISVSKKEMLEQIDEVIPMDQK